MSAEGGLSKRAQKKAAQKAAKKLKKQQAKAKAQGGANKGDVVLLEGQPLTTDPIAGVRDFPPEKMRIRNWLFEEWRKTARLFAFEEYDAPVLEYEELYTRKGGEEITEQMYNFVDKGKQAVALRPEMTPSLARLILQKGKSLLLPAKWFSIPQCWRYETVCRGRRREHFQWNMDIFGVSQVTAEAELLAAIVTFFKGVGLTEKEVGIKVSSRKVVSTILAELKVPDEKFAATCVIVDKLDKLEREDVEAQLTDPKMGLSKEVAGKIIDTLSPNTTLDEMAKKLGEDSDVIKEMREVFKLAEAYGIADWLQFDASIIRGLVYYTGIVFEGFDRSGNIPRSICGGGRYDTLLSKYGAKNKPACGFGFGDCVILEVLEDIQKLPNLERIVDDVVLAFNEEIPRPRNFYRYNLEGKRPRC
eukprot:TRINITY_DN2820_c0_g2_i1.p1 TRINITY_DN2820_c0_g2~~TRINITY_DN2820_c0_g2_i1.p1  ORF type:complete len:447 (-),score=100.09 TRINITY_DN2820_c0_g2_i1:189-1439(-)